MKADIKKRLARMAQGMIDMADEVQCAVEANDLDTAECSADAALQDSQKAALAWVRDRKEHSEIVGEEQGAALSYTQEPPCPICMESYLCFQRAAERAAELLEAQEGLRKIHELLDGSRDDKQ